MLPNQLSGIGNEKRKKTNEILDELLSTALISGYNWYDQVPSSLRIVTFSHMHETAEYRKAMQDDMVQKGYSSEIIDKNIRAKSACYRWEPDFIFRDESGKIFENLKIRKGNNEYLDLGKYAENSLAGRVELQGERLFGENDGWELNIPFDSKEGLLGLVNLFIRKSSRKNVDHWPGAYDVPVLIIGGKAKDYAQELPDFIEARKISLIENGNEISFIIRKKFDELSKNPLYQELRNLNFSEETCLGNKTFIESYVDSG